MPYRQEIKNNLENPKGLETLFLEALQLQEADQFKSDLETCLADHPNALLLQAWHFRLSGSTSELKTLTHIPSVEKQTTAPSTNLAAGVNWKLALPLALLNGVLFWVLTVDSLNITNDAPLLLVLAAPVAALIIIAYLVSSAGRDTRRAALIGAGLVILSAAALLLRRYVAVRSADDYLILMIPHLALLAWAAVGVYLTGRSPTAGNSFAFLSKSLEVFLVGGVYLIAGVALGAVTLGMFAALSVELPEALMRLIAAGGAGLLPVVAVATIYNPLEEPQNQDFKGGLSKFINLLMRLLLPLTLGVLIVYILVIPFNFLQPFQNRDVLIVYNIMLFGIMGIIVGATPLNLDELTPRLASLLQKGILILAVLGTLVSLYALSAILYRTATAAITINRLTTIGWNTINIALLIAVINQLARKRSLPWNEGIKAVYRLGAYAYLAWTVIIILAAPFLFR